MSIRLIAGLFALLMAAGAAHAVNPDEVLEDAALETRARDISAGLRCLVCQNQSIDDSDAPLARDLRLLVRERLTEGDSDAEVISLVVDRYGDFVLLKPPVNASTYLLWFAPIILLAFGVFAIFRLFRRPAPSSSAAGLNPDEERRLKKLLEDTEPGAAGRN